MAVFYYHAASLAKVPSGTLMIETAEGPVPAKRLLAEEIVSRQRADGSWTNPAHAIREDDPILATSFALLALS